MQSLNDLSDFFTNKIGAPAGDEEALIKPLLRVSSNHSLSAFSSGIDNEYIGPNSSVNPSSNVILWSYCRCGGSILATAFLNNGMKS